MDLLCFCSVLCLLCFVGVCLYVLCGHLLGKADLLALVCAVFCEFVTFPLVSWVRCGTWLYRFLIFATLLTFIIRPKIQNGRQYLRWLPIKETVFLIFQFWFHSFANTTLIMTQLLINKFYKKIAVDFIKFKMAADYQNGHILLFENTVSKKNILQIF